MISKSAKLPIGASCAALILLLAPVVAPEANPLDGIDGQIESMMAAWTVPGTAVAIIKDDEVIKSRGYGLRTADKPGKVDDRTLFAIGSSSKAFTAAGMAMLVDEKKLSWDDPVSDYLPWFELFDPYVTRELRVRDLLAHNSGLTRGDRVWYGTELSREEIVRRARFLPPTHSLRAKFQYNNTMFIAAGLVIEAVSGKNWDEFTHERLLQPLGMSNSTTTIRKLSGRKNVATPHKDVDGRAVPVPWRNIDNAGPAGSINSNIAEMAQWVRLQLGGGEIDGVRLISEKNIAEMQSAQMLMTKEGLWGAIFSDSALISYGLGWFLAEHEGRLMVNHGGNIDGNTAFVSFMPEENLGLVILSNMNAANGFIAALNYEIYERMLDVGDKDWSAQLAAVMAAADSEAEQAAQKIRNARVPDTSPSLPLTAYVGAYEHDMYPGVSVELRGDALFATYAGAFTARLKHWHFDTFEAIWSDPGPAGEGPSLIRFDLDSNGRPGVAHVDIEGPVPFQRAPEMKDGVNQ